MARSARQHQFIHIVTIGTSLLTNVGWKHGQPLPTRQTLLSLLRNNPRRASAELNALIPFIERGECTRVHLLATDTPECRRCREAIGLYLHERGIQTADGKTAGLLPHAINRAANQGEFHTAIRHFREAVFRVADRARQRGDTVLLNVTGGLKAESIVAVLAAAELRPQLQAYYIHESMTEPVYLPIAPLDPQMLQALRLLSKNPQRRPRIAPDMLDRLQREAMITVSRRADGEISSIRLTRFAKHLLKTIFE